VNKKIFYILILGLFLLTFKTFATTFRPMPLDKLIEESNMAAEVELKSKKSFMNDMGLIFTEYTFGINDSFNLPASDLDGEFLKLTMTGGTVDGVTSYIDSAPEFAVGEKSFLLLKKIESKIYLSNFTMGKYKIEEKDGQVFYVSSVFPADAELGKVKKEKMVELVKLKFKITEVPLNKLNESNDKKYFQKEEKTEFEKRTPAQESLDEKASSDGVIAMWAFFALFLCSGFTIWWKLKKGTSV
jgi:hypothetical protein